MISEFRKYFVLAALAAISITLGGCASSRSADELSEDELYTQAKELMAEEEYREAMKLLEVLKLQYPASQYADDAQYMIADIHFQREEYILAAFNFSNVRKYYPGSQYVRESMYKAALCLYNLSPSFARDQDYTVKAIKSFSEYQTLYPERDSLYLEAGRIIDDLRNKLAHKEYFIAELYRKMNYPESSLIYYDSVIDNYVDTEYYEPAYFGKIETLVAVGRYDDARSLISLYRRQFPAGEFLDEVAELENEARNETK